MPVSCAACGRHWQDEARSGNLLNTIGLNLLTDIADRQDGSGDAARMVMDLARDVAAIGEAMDLPYIAVSADIGSPDPMCDAKGQPLAETLFRWIDPDLTYWKDRAFALRSGFVRGARTCAEPFYCSKGQIGSWRHVAALDGLAETMNTDAFDIGGAIISPCHLPSGVIGAIVWATPDRTLDVSGVFDARAAELHVLTLKLMATYHDFKRASPTDLAVALTRREIQCLKWAAAGKTDHEIATIIGISQPTVRFHITNSSRKLGVSGRSQAVHRATTLGYIGGGST